MTVTGATKADTLRRVAAAVTTALTALIVLTGCGGSASSSTVVSTRFLSSSSTPGATSTTSATTAASTDAEIRCDPEPCQLTHAELAAKLDDLCIRGNAAVKQADASFEQGTKVSEYTKAATAMRAALLEFPPYQSAVQGLTPPAQDRTVFTRYVDLTRRIHELSERIVGAGRARDNPEVIRLSQLVREELATRTTAAVDLGTRHCGH